tara:strand:+ start:866 stop:1315 length:450 start_codon:yes stop_codon:yes gene_type:complete
MLIQYSKEHEGIKSPTRANPSDAGLDIYADLMEEVEIFPGCNKVIPTGLKFEVPHGHMLQVCNRSSMGAKHCLIVGAHIIDSGYAGEVFIDLHNVGNSPKTISPGDKIAQVIMVPVVSFRTMEVKAEELYQAPVTISNRGDGALGSTGG